MSPERRQIFIAENDGHMVPSWSKVSSEFGLGRLPKAERRVLVRFVGAHLRMIGGQKERGRQKMDSLEKHPVFVGLEKRDPDLLTQITEFIRKGRGR